MMIVDLPWPDRRLHPNARVHWGVKARASKKARADAKIAMRAAGIRKLQSSGIAVTAIFAPPDNRRRDADGMLASLKPSFDGIADAIGIDDSKWDIAIRRAEPVKGGNVRIEIEVK